jgi:hypothetical protein
MNVLVVAAAGALFGLGAVLIVRGATGTTIPLAALVSDLHAPRDRGEAPATRRGALAQRVAGRDSSSRRADLAVCDRSLDKYAQDRLTWSLLFAAPALSLTTLASTGAASFGPVPLLLVGVLVGSACGWCFGRADLRTDAIKARRDFRHALAGYLELVTILMSGGAGVETAMFDAAAIGRGPAFRQLMSSLSASQARREAPWRSLGALGANLGISELEELEASMTLAGGGAQVRDSLTAKAAGIRMKDLADIESHAQARSETMVLPVALMFAGFLVLIGYPALAALSGS